MSIVTLVSGGLDSTVMAVLAKEEGITQYPLFVDYGQLGRARELRACRGNFRRHELPTPHIAKLPGYGALLPSGLTTQTKDVFDDAFLPCRNLLFLSVGAAYAFQREASGVAIGLLSEASCIFPDQTNAFLSEAEAILTRALGRSVTVITPLRNFSKADVLALARERGVQDTYSCHAGGPVPCGRCVACREYVGLET